MPYESRDDLPGPVGDDLPKHAKDIHLEAFNVARDGYAEADDRQGDDSRAAAAHQVGWAAAKKVYVKGPGTMDQTR